MSQTEIFGDFRLSNRNTTLTTNEMEWLIYLRSEYGRVQAPTLAQIQALRRAKLTMSETSGLGGGRR